MSLFRLPLLPAAALIAVLPSQPARAELPDPVHAMIEAAIATGDEGKVTTVVDLARQTNPDDAAEIAVLHETFLVRRRELAAAEALAAQQALRDAGFFENWSGKGEVGASHSSGNSEDTGLTAALSLERTGIDWQHRFRARADYQRSNGRTSRERYLAAYEPRFNVSPNLFAYALAQYESDRFQGFTSRVSTSGGVGHQVVDSETLELSVKVGPAWRRTHFVNGGSESSLGALAGLDFDWRILPQLTLTQDTDLVAESGGSVQAIIDSSSTSVSLITGLEARISDGLTTRLSYTVDYDSDPPPGGVSTDTLTRFSLVYGF